MDYRALIQELGLHQYEKEISAATITSIKWHKTKKQVSIFLCVNQTWEFALFQDFKQAFEQLTGCVVELQFMAKATDLSMKDIALYLKECANFDHRAAIYGSLLPVLEEDAIVCDVSRKDYKKAQEAYDSVSTMLQHWGIVTPLTIREKKITVDVSMETKAFVSSSNRGPVTSGRRAPAAFYTAKQVDEIVEEVSDIEIKGKIFWVESSENRKKGTLIMSYYVTDYTNSLIVKAFEGMRFHRDFLLSLNINDEVIVCGSVVQDSFAKELVLMADSIAAAEVFPKRQDLLPEKRIELHAHTKMSEMDAVCDVGALIAQAAAFGHKGIAITDHMVVQAYPDAQKAADKARKKNPDFKVLYGIEMNMVDPTLDIVLRPRKQLLKEVEFVLFDLETTGLSCRYDDIIEFGAVVMKHGDILERMQMFVKPNQSISAFITEKTSITNEMVAGAKPIEALLPQILELFQDRVLVAHNAKFDIGFMTEVLRKHGYPSLTNPVVDTLDLAKAMWKSRRLYSLGHIARSYKIAYDEETAHRADYDANVLASVFQLMLYDLARDYQVQSLEELQGIQDEDSFKKVWKKHVTLLVKNQQGLKDLFELVTLSNSKYLAYSGKSSSKEEEYVAEPRIIREEIQRLREHLLVGSSCLNNEVFDTAANKSWEELLKVISFYDYIEIQSIENYSNLLATNSVKNAERLKQILLDIIKGAKEMNKLVVVSGDVHYIHPEDKIFRDVYIQSQGIGGVRHPLYIYNKEKRWATTSPNQHLRTTQEMLDLFDFLPAEEAFQYVVTNTHAIYDQIEVVKPIKDSLFTPHIAGEETLTELCYAKARQMYGTDLPKLVDDRLKKELDSIIGNGFAVIYYVSHLLVKKSLEDGYLVGSRGSVGSSFVATMATITEVNPLPPHYYCPNCQHSEFFEDGSIASGYDLPDKPCPHCGTTMIGDGQDIPFETFLGFEGDKVPDIDLNFSGEYQEHAHAYTKVVFGEDKVYRAGTIGGVAEKTAYGYVSGYLEEFNKIDTRGAERTRLAMGCQDVKRTTGQHPGGIIVIPEYMDVHDFTPIQYPANNPDSAWKTSHFDFHAIHDNVLKLDILGHVDPTAMKMYERISGIDPKTIPMNDTKVISIFNSIDALCMDTTMSGEKTGAVGLPEFGTQFVRGMLEATKPSTFAELVQISGLSHGTDVWLNNAKDLIDNNTCVLKEVIGCRDDIMVYLIQKGLPSKSAFDIMESVRKGKGLKEDWKQLMRDNQVPEWYIESCLRIKYMFPKAHAVAYVLMAVRVAWFKVYHPHYYYAVYFTTRCDVFDLEVMTKGARAIKERLNDIAMRLNHQELKKSVTNKEISLITTLEVALEMYLRGYSMANIDLHKSEANDFIVDPDDAHVIIPPFGALDGLGANVALSIIEAREQQPFISQQDMMQRSQINQTSLKKLESMGVLDNLQKENQLSLF